MRGGRITFGAGVTRMMALDSRRWLPSTGCPSSVEADGVHEQGPNHVRHCMHMQNLEDILASGAILGL